MSLRLVKLSNAIQDCIHISKNLIIVFLVLFLHDKNTFRELIANLICCTIYAMELGKPYLITKMQFIFPSNYLTRSLRSS